MASPSRSAPFSMPAWRTFEEAPPAASSGIGTLGALAIAIGVGVIGVYVLDLHGHTCACGHRWRHFGAFNLGDEESHTCSNCGQVQWWKCGAPHVLRGSQYVMPPQLPATGAPSISAPAVPVLAAAPASSLSLPMSPSATPSTTPSTALAVRELRR